MDIFKLFQTYYLIIIILSLIMDFSVNNKMVYYKYKNEYLNFIKWTKFDISNGNN